MPGNSTKRLTLLAGLLMVPTILTLTLWAWRGLDESVAADRHRFQRFEELASAQVVNNLGSELFHLFFSFAQGMNAMGPGDDAQTSLDQIVARYRREAHQPALLSDVFLVDEGARGSLKWSRWGDLGWTAVAQPSWMDAGRLLPSGDDVMVDLERPYAVFRWAPGLARKQAVVVRYSVDTVLGTLVPALAAKAFRQQSDSYDYDVRVVREGPGPAGDSAKNADLVVPLVPRVRFSDWLASYLDHADTLPAAPEAYVPTARWSLEVTLMPQGLKAYVDQRFRKNLLWVSGLVLVLLVGMGVMVLALRTLARTSRRERAFSSLVSHELKTPLAAIKSLSENLSDGVVQNGDRVKAYGAQILAESRRLGELVGNILALTVLDASDQALVREPVDLQDLGATVAQRAGVPFRDGPGSWRARGHRAALGAALDNLVTNALRYGVLEGAEPEVVVGLERRRRWGRSWVGISVADRGPGLTSDDLGHLFQPYRRGHQADERHVAGSGVGLSLVKTTMRQLGGQVQVQTSPGRGLKMTLWLKER